MAKYTITIQSLKKNNFDFGLKNYPIFDEAYRETLNNNILNHYLVYEIGFETAELFKFYLNQTMNEIMPKYNILYQKQLEFLPNLDKNVDYVEDFKGKSTSNTNANSTSKNNGKGNSKNVFLDTPQGDEYKGTINDTNYATNVTFNNSESENSITDNSETNGNGTNDYVKTILASQGKYKIELLNDIKNSIMNIDLMIITELNDLFFGLL